MEVARMDVEAAEHGRMKIFLMVSLGTIMINWVIFKVLAVLWIEVLGRYYAVFALLNFLPYIVLMVAFRNQTDDALRSGYTWFVRIVVLNIVLGVVSIFYDYEAVIGTLLYYTVAIISFLDFLLPMIDYVSYTRVGLYWLPLVLICLTLMRHSEHRQMRLVSKVTLVSLPVTVLTWLMPEWHIPYVAPLVLWLSGMLWIEWNRDRQAQL
jgi:hypothetical protein